MSYYCGTVKITGKAFELINDEQHKMSKTPSGDFKSKMPYPQVIQRLLEELAELKDKKNET